MSTINVRQAVLSDIDGLANVFDSYRQFYDRVSDIVAAKDFLLARFNHGESILFIAVEGEEIVGFAQLYPAFSSVSLARTFVLNDLFVDAPARRKGVARRLVAAALEFAGTVGAVRISLSTATSNESAQALYQSLGWKRDEQFLVYHFAIST